VAQYAADPNERLASIAQIVAYLQEDPDARKEFARDPESFLTRAGFESSALEAEHGGEALDRARRALDGARLSSEDTLTTALPKLSQAAEDVFGSDYRVDIEPFAVNFLERPTLNTSLGFKWTITGRIRCTFDGWDGCSIGLDW
jgi:hypothetical protein